MRPTLIVCSILCASLAMVRSAQAQDTDSFEPASQAHRPGRWSMQFQLVDDFQFSAFEGAGLAMTRNAGTNNAWRFGVSFDGLFSEDKWTTTTTTDSTSLQEVEPTDRHQYSVRLDLLRLHRYHPARRVGLELGVGPRVDLARYRDQFESNDPAYPAARENRASSSSYGLAGRLGVEVFLARALSVHAHYGAFAGYQQVTSTARYEITDPGIPTAAAIFESQRRRWFLSNEGVGMGISVYL